MTTTAKRPGIVLVAAILLLVYGGYRILGGFCAMVNVVFSEAMQAALGPANNQADLNAILKQEVPFHNLVEVSNSVVQLVLGVVAVVAGFGVMKMNPASRVLGIRVAWCSILVTVVYGVYTAVFVLPSLNHVVEQQVKLMGLPPADVDTAKAAAKIAAHGITIIGIVINLAIWLAIIFLLQSKTSRDAFEGKLPPESEPSEEPRRRSSYAGYEDEDDLPPPLPKSPPDTGITDRSGP